MIVSNKAIEAIEAIFVENIKAMDEAVVKHDDVKAGIYANICCNVEEILGIMRDTSENTEHTYLYNKYNLWSDEWMHEDVITFRLNWSDQDVKMHTTGLTQLEIKALQASRNNEFHDAIDFSTWTFTVQENSGISASAFRGVCASLVKKGYCNISVYTGDQAIDGGTESYFTLTKLGKSLFSDYNKGE